MFCCKKKKSDYSPRSVSSGSAEHRNDGDKNGATGNGRPSLTISAPFVSGSEVEGQVPDEPAYENHTVIPKTLRKAKVDDAGVADVVAASPVDSDAVEVVDGEAPGTEGDEVEKTENVVSTEHVILAEISELDAVDQQLKPEDLQKALAEVSKVLSLVDNMSSETLTTAVSRLESVAARLEALANRQTGKKSETVSEATAPYVDAFGEILNGPFAKYVALSNEIGDIVKTQSELVKQAFQAQRDFLSVSSKSKQPNQDVLIKLLQPTSIKIQEIQDLREKNRASKFFNHLSAISESIGCLGWVAVSPAPGPFVKEMLDSGTFYTNRVLKDYKETDPRHVEWTKAWNKTIADMQAYIKEHHTTGVAWNPQGGDAGSVTASAVGTPGGPAPPPPPGPPPPPPPADVDSVASSGDGDRNALFNSINKGTEVTKGLKKVTDDMKTHKNPALRQGPAPFRPTGTAPKTAPKPSAKPTPVQSHPPVTELQGKKWVVQYHQGNHNIVISETELKQTVYVFKCTECTVQVKGKVNSIILDSCKKTSVAFEDLVSSLEFVNCQSVKAQVTKKMPTVTIDKTDGCMIYLSRDALDASIISAKSSEMNILVPSADDGDYKEYSLPEQFKTEWNGSKFITVPTESI